MVVVEASHPQDAQHIPLIQSLGDWLCKKLAVEGVLEVFLVGDEYMQKNVLAFPADTSFPRPDLGPQKALGEIYLNPTYIAAHSEALDYMFVHGFLHIIGYDHIEKSDRITMEKEEKRLLRAYTEEQ